MHLTGHLRPVGIGGALTGLRSYVTSLAAGIDVERSLTCHLACPLRVARCLDVDRHACRYVEVLVDGRVIA